MVTKARRIKAAESQVDAFVAEEKSVQKPVGSSGTQVHGGYFAEEYLPSLRGKRGAAVWDEMRRSEAQVAMLLGAVMNPIKSACWEFEAPVDSGSDGEKQVELLNEVFKKRLDWESFLHEALTFVPFGFSLFEVIHEVVLNHPKLGTFNGVKAMAFRSQKTIEQWNLDKVTGKLESVLQYTYSDVGTSALIPADFLTLFVLHKEGDNYEGISALRPMYGAYFRKNLYLKLAAIGVEKYAVGTPIGTVPAGKEKSAEFEKFKQILSAYTSHQSAFILKAQGWDIEIQKGEFDADKVKEMILLENTEMINALVANFLALGTNGGGGAYALGSDLSDFFLGGIQNLAQIICGVFNRKLIPSLVSMNYGPQEEYPVLKCTGINDKAGKELAEIIQFMANSGVIKPDDKLEAAIRKQYKLPEADPASAREKAQAQPIDPKTGKPMEPKPGMKQDMPAQDMPAQDMEDEMPMQYAERLLLDEKYRKKFDANKDAVKAVMQSGLRKILDDLKAKLAKAWNGANAEQRKAIITQVEAGGVNEYKAALREVLAEVANQAIDWAQKTTGKRIKLAESIQLAAPRGGYYSKLDPKVKRLVLAQASLIGDTQVADLEKVVLFQFASSATAYDDVQAILNDVEEKAGKVLEGATGSGMSIEAAASNAVANAANQASLEFFFEPEVLDGIESFTFTNEDPVSPICQELAGTTFAVGDPDLDRYSPPLHHNCKSRLVPNLKGDKANPPIDRGGLSLTRKALDSVTLCEPDYRIFSRSS